jgi:ferredoxin-NADP reductase
MEVSQRAPGRWQIATVTNIKRETPRVKSFTFELPMWMPHLPGQHYDVRLVLGRLLATRQAEHRAHDRPPG